jgi:hypothetical protein
MYNLKISIFTYKIINDQSNIPVVFGQTIQLASACHSYNTRFADNQNFSRPRARTNYGVHTFNFVSSQIWQSIDSEIKLASSVTSFRKKIFTKLNTSNYLFFS